MASNKKPNTVQTAVKLIAPILEKEGIDLWDARFEKEGSDWYLRYFIDKEGGVNIQDCERVSRAISSRLDEEDPIEQGYILEVSSPGLERELVKDWHFQRYLGQVVTVRLIRPVEGRRTFTGTLLSKEDDTITIRLEEDLEMSFLRKEAAYIRLYVDFESGGFEA